MANAVHAVHHPPVANVLRLNMRCASAKLDPFFFLVVFRKKKVLISYNYGLKYIYMVYIYIVIYNIYHGISIYPSF